MRKKAIITAVLCMVLFCLASCGKTRQEQGMEKGDVSAAEADTKPEEKEKEEENNTTGKDAQGSDNKKELMKEKEDKKVLIYYGNDNADGIIYKEVTLNDWSIEALIDELAKVNIVSLDTKVRAVYVDETNTKLLHLDMSKEFGEYVSMMGTAGEYIVIGGLVDTFLDAYGCENVKITVEGKTLETGHAAYDGELQFIQVTDNEQ